MNQLSKPKPVVGQIVYSLNIGNAARNCKQELTEYVVVKVGTKYFDIMKKSYYDEARYAARDKHMSISFHLGTWRQNTNYCQDHKLYETSEEYYMEKETKDCIEYIQNADLKSVSLDHLRHIVSLIKGESV